VHASEDKLRVVDWQSLISVISGVACTYTTGTTGLDSISTTGITSLLLQESNNALTQIKIKFNLTFTIHPEF